MSDPVTPASPTTDRDAPNGGDEGRYGQQPFAADASSGGKTDVDAAGSRDAAKRPVDVAHVDVAAGDIPPDNGRRATFTPRTGEVRGSGVGTGGGSEGEDFDSDAANGDAYPQTGRQAE